MPKSKKIKENAKVFFNLRIPADLHRELDRWIDAQAIKPFKTAVIIAALEDFLKKK